MFIYESLANSIASAINSGQLPPGSRLQSIREYANIKKVSVNTVKSAFRLLENQGLIIARPQSGYFVTNKITKTLVTGLASKMYDKLSPAGINMILNIILDNQSNINYLNLALASPNGDEFYPTKRLFKITSQVLRSKKNNIASYALPPGSLRLRTQIARRGLLLGMSLRADDILITHGAMEALNLAVRATTQPGMGVAVETPTFYNLYSMLKELNRTIIEIPTDPKTGICLDSLIDRINEGVVSAIIVVPCGQNPLGFTMPVENRKRLVKIAKEHKIPIIEDAMYAELQFSNHLVPNLKAFDEEGWVLVCSSYTKTIAPDFRIGWLEAGRFSKFASQLKFASTVAESEILSDVLGRFLENGSYELHLRYLRKLYKQRIETVRDIILKYFPQGTHVSTPESGFILWLELPRSYDTLAIFYTALEENILCMPGVLCSSSQLYNHCLRIAACFGLDELHLQGLKRLGEIACSQRDGHV